MKTILSICIAALTFVCFSQEKELKPETLGDSAQIIKHSKFATSYWEERGERGTISIDVSTLTNSARPLRCLISTEPIPSLGEMRKFIRDSLEWKLHGRSDQAFDDKKIHTFEGLVSNKYYVAVIDANDNRLVDEELFLGDRITLADEKGLYVSDDNIIAAQEKKSSAAIDLYAVNLEELDVRFETLRKKFSFKPRSYGIIKESKKEISYEDLVVGFYKKGFRTYLVENGRLVKKFPFKFGEKNFRIRNLGKNLVLETNKRVFSSEESKLEGSYMIGIQMPRRTRLRTYYCGFSKFPFFVNVLNQLGSCFGSFGKIQVNVSNGMSSIISLQNAQCSVTLNGVSVPSSSSTLSSFVFDNLLAGNYQVNVSGDTYFLGSFWNSFQYQNVVTVQNKVNWANRIEAVSVPSINALHRESLNSSSTGSARANHIVAPSESEVYFNLDLDYGFNYALVDWSDQFHSLGGINISHGFLFLRFFGGYPLVFSLDQYGILSGPISVSPNAKLCVRYNAVSGTADLNVLNSLGYETPIFSNVSLGSAEHFNAFPGNKIGKGFRNVSTTMECNTKEVYAKVDRKLTGVKYKVIENELLFYVTEEYDSQTGELNYFIYEDDDRAASVTSGGQQILPVEYGDNRYRLEVSALTSGSYILEVLNDKKEKFYLRFIK